MWLGLLRRPVGCLRRWRSTAPSGGCGMCGPKRVAMRRADRSSVYTVGGADLFSFARIVDAELPLIATAGRTDGRTVDAVAVDLALLESAGNGVALDAGQAALVISSGRQGCGRRPSGGRPEEWTHAGRWNRPQQPPDPATAVRRRDEANTCQLATRLEPGDPRPAA